MVSQSARKTSVLKMCFGLADIAVPLTHAALYYYPFTSLSCVSVAPPWGVGLCVAGGKGRV